MATYRERFQQAVSAAVAGASDSVPRVTVATSNKRAARVVKDAAETQLRREGREVWPTPDVLPYGALVARLHAAAVVAGECNRQPLSREQELQLWRQIIERSPSGRELLLPEAAAVEASRAFRTACQWEINLRSAQMSATSETRAFSGWATEFISQLDERGWTCEPLLERQVAAVLPKLVLPEELHVFLSALPPASRSFCDALQAAGVRVAFAESGEDAETRCERREFNGESDELIAAAAWTRAQVQAAPASRVGVIFFDLARRRAAVESAFRQVLHPEQLLGESSAPAFEIAAATPLAEYAPVDCALHWLSLPVRELDFNDFAAMLTSPYLPLDLQQAACFVHQVRRVARREVRLEELVAWLRERPDAPARLRDALIPLPPHQDFASQQSAFVWVTFARELLERLGWPGAVKQNSEEYQCELKWSELLASMAALDLLGWRGDYAEFVQQLERAAAAEAFQPETLGAPVQVMDAGEAEGSVFDALWIGAASDEAWPSTPAPSPLLPHTLLRDAGFPLPGGEAAQLQIAASTARLLHSSPQVTLSLALRTDDEREQRWSPAFVALPLAASLAELPQPLPLRFAPAFLEELVDEAAPAMSVDETLRGGTSLLANQSVCPFRAFAVHRLRSPQAEGPNEELAATDRGKVVERALELIWAELKSSDGLNRSGLRELIAAKVREAMHEVLPARGDAWTRRFRELERERTMALIEEWLALEAQRAPFRVIAHQRKVQVTLAGRKLTGRIDRLDEVAGATLVLDYKTGADTAASAWTVPRPRLPQLPLYAVQQQRDGAEVAGVAFASLRRGTAAFKSFLKDKALLPGGSSRAFAHEDFTAYITQWSEELERLAAAHVAGQAEVDPKVPPSRSGSSCLLCHLQPLCRVGDDEAAETEDEGGEDE